MVLTVDMSLNSFGWCILDKGIPIQAGVIQTKKNKAKGIRKVEDYVSRISYLSKSLIELFKQYPIRMVTGEMTSFGSQSSDATVSLTASAAAMLALCEGFGIQPLWVTPNECKQAFTGITTASKQDMMLAACKRYNWSHTNKDIKSKASKQIIRTATTYHVMGRQYPGGIFEHVADALSAYEAAKLKGRIPVND